MKKLKIGGIVLVVLLLSGLLIFASTHKYSDSHLRKEGVRVRSDEYSLMVDDCDENSDYVTCHKTIKVGEKEEQLIFELKDFNKEGYPKTAVGAINGHEFLKKSNLDFPTNGSANYQAFLNFNVIDNKYIAFTYSDGANGLSTTLYVIDTNGNIILQEKELDEDGMLIKDYTEFIKYDVNNIEVYATRLKDNLYYHDANICKAPDNAIIEAYYTYTYKDGKFTKKQTKAISAKDYIKDNGVNCKDID